MLQAASFAEKIGVDLNCHVTVDFPAGIDETAIPKLIAAALKAWKQWVRRQTSGSGITAYIWARERRADQASHVHLVLHVPPELRGRVTASRFTAFFPDEGGLRQLIIDDNAARNSGTPVLVQHNTSHQPRFVRYIAKGLERTAYAEFPEIDRPSPQGRITGKRFGISENIGQIERQRWRLEERIWGGDKARGWWLERGAMSKRPARRRSR